nr:nucleotide-binding protein [Vibrio cyclitrophicus]PMG81986.1 nucleotide-binding protein [Vibrio cyclitrophicus]
MTDYYHVILETTEKNAKGRNEHVYWFDCQDLIELDEDIVEPYVNKSQVYIGGRYVQFDEIRSLTIKKSQQPIDVLVNAAQARVPSNVLWIPQRTGVVLGENGLDNVTKKLVKEKQALVKENTNVSGMKKNVDHSNSSVFIVHGHDNEAKLDMARFLEKAGLEPIVLHEQASSSQTIIEKIESYSDVGYAVILYTPCDIGAKNSAEAELSPRARQNVVFEHGYFIGHLGRSKVSAFVKGDIEKPNDISGVVYTELDHAGAWKMVLLKELKKVGYQVNSDALL